jgi:hypothetical protein
MWADDHAQSAVAGDRPLPALHCPQGQRRQDAPHDVANQLAASRAVVLARGADRARGTSGLTAPTKVVSTDQTLVSTLAAGSLDAAG